MLMAAEHRGAAQAVHPRLPADGRAQDVEVARQRDRPVRGHRRSTAPTRCASTCCARSSFGQDGSLSPEGFETRYDAELANEYGNLASRTLAMIGRYRDGVVPEPSPTPSWRRSSTASTERVREQLDAVELDAARSRTIWQRVRRLNRFVQDEEPWKLAKDEARAGELDQVLYTLAEGLRVVSVLLHPVHAGAGRAAARPRSVRRTARSTARSSARVGGGATLGELGQLFPRVEPQAEAAAGRRGRHPLPPRLLRAARRRAGGERARRSGVNRIATVGMNDAVDRARARRGRRATTASWRSSAATRTTSDGLAATADIEPIERAAADPRAPRDRRDRASTTSATAPRATTSGARSRPSSTSPRAAGCRS